MISTDGLEFLFERIVDNKRELPGLLTHGSSRRNDINLKISLSF